MIKVLGEKKKKQKELGKALLFHFIGSFVCVFSRKMFFKLKMCTNYVKYLDKLFF